MDNFYEEDLTMNEKTLQSLSDAHLTMLKDVNSDRAKQAEKELHAAHLTLQLIQTERKRRAEGGKVVSEGVNVKMDKWSKVYG